MNIPNWRNIQSTLDRGRICPICGKIFNTRFPSHLLNCHGIDRYKYVCMLNNLLEIPKCANPNCNNYVDLDWCNRGYSFKLYCSRSCDINHRVSSGSHNFLQENLEYDEYGRSIIAIRLNESRLLSGNHPWLKHNLKLDDRGCSINHTKSNYTRVINGNHNFTYDNIPRDANGSSLYALQSIETKRINGTHNWAYNGDPEHDKLIYEDRRSKMIHCLNTCRYLGSTTGLSSSDPENLLYDLLIELDSNILRGRDCKVQKDDGYYYYPDFYSSKYDCFIECDGMYKYENCKLTKQYVDRHNYIVNKTNKHMLHIPSNDVFYYRHNLNNLENIILSELDRDSLTYDGD